MRCLHRHRALVKTPTEDWQWSYQIMCRVCMAISQPMPAGLVAQFEWNWETAHGEQPGN